MKKFDLPPAPPSENGPVKAWAEPVVLPTYEPMPPDKNPMFLEKRVYQGSSGRVYPLPFTDRISTEPRYRAWRALHIENEFLRVMVLPEIGGRIHVGLDKTNGYDFFYRQNVIKPALVGLAGPWISGGVEFNWPQHHRPATFMPVHFTIEAGADGSRTLWCGDHDPMNRLRGMHGVCLYPGMACIELKVRLYNRTPLTQTFLWWANVATHVHQHYQSFFPPDVHFVADHARRAMSSFPLCDGVYYGVDYGERAKGGIPPNEQPSHFIPPGTYLSNDLSWYANIPVPTSYMAIGSQQDFMGGYDHAARAGLVHVSNHHIAPGKKQWTWGNHDFGHAWDRNLTDWDGPYIELMAGVYTDNQPDFSFLAPGETRTFSQFWYPIREIGPPQKANADTAVSLKLEGGSARIGVSVTHAFPAARVILASDSETVYEQVADLSPSAPFITEVPVAPNTKESQFSLSVRTAEDRLLIHHQPKPSAGLVAPQPATEPPLPKKIKTLEELYLTGLHLEQYRHATRLPEDYWREALRRSPKDARCNNAMGLWHLRRGEFALAERHFRTAITTLTERNANPYDGEPYYNLGLTLRFLNRDEDAYAAFYKATWNSAFRGCAFHALAEIDACHGSWKLALEHTLAALRLNADNLNARNLAALLLRQLNRNAEADALLRETLALDPLDPFAAILSRNRRTWDNQTLLDVCFDLARAGFYSEAAAVLDGADISALDGSVPMVLYTKAFLRKKTGRREDARLAAPDYCFPNRLEELLVLEEALRNEPADSRAHYYLGNWLYDRRRYPEAISHWEKAASLEPHFSTVWRNLGIAYFNNQNDAAKSRGAFERAVEANPLDARVFYERDQLWKRTGAAPAVRLVEFEERADLVSVRDDLSVELAALYNQTGQPEKALEILSNRKFQPWEGGEGLALSQYVQANLRLGQAALAARRDCDALTYFQAALDCPANLGEARHPLTIPSNIYYWLGLTHEALGEHVKACDTWRKASLKQPYSEMTYYDAMSLQLLGEREQANSLLKDLLAYGKNLARQKAQIDYFATSLPTMLLFNDDLEKRKNVLAFFLQALARQGLGQERVARDLLHRVIKLDPNDAAVSQFNYEIAFEVPLDMRAICK